MRNTIRAIVFSTITASVLLGVAPGFEARDAEAGILRRVLARIFGGGQHDQGNRGAHQVPELDPNAAGQAALLVLGGTAIALHGRRKKEA
jgi:hypothetical protein